MEVEELTQEEETIQALRDLVESQGRVIQNLLSLIADRGFEREAKKLLASV